MRTRILALDPDPNLNLNPNLLHSLNSQLAMYATETKNQFIELRAEGLSLDTISSRLNVPRATLGRWHHESIEQIQRLRALQWHLLEEQIGERLEETLTRIAQRIRKWDDKLDRQLTVYQKPGDSMRVIRDSRREYLQLRALLLAPLQPTRGRTACLASLDPHKRDKTRQNPDALDTTFLSTNDLQQPEPATSHFPDFVADDVPNQVTSPESALNHNHTLNLDPASAPPRLCGEPPSPQPPINTPLQRGEPAEPPATPTASAVSSRPHGESDSSSPRSDDNVAPGILPANEPGVSPGDAPPVVQKRHKPYWLNGHYYQNPEYPEHIARAISPLSAGKGLE